MLTADIHPKGRAFADRVSEESDMPCICCIGNLSCFELFGLFFCKPTNKWIYMKLECFCHFSEYAREGGLRWYCFWLLLLACLPACPLVHMLHVVSWLAGLQDNFYPVESLINIWIYILRGRNVIPMEGRKVGEPKPTGLPIRFLDRTSNEQENVICKSIYFPIFWSSFIHSSVVVALLVVHWLAGWLCQKFSAICCGSGRLVVPSYAVDSLSLYSLTQDDACSL